MTEHAPSSIESIAQSLVDSAPHYVDSVASMTRNRELSATEDIMSSSGVKLVARGAKVDAHLLNLLAAHRLTTPTLEQSVTIDGVVTPASLAQDISQLIDGDAWFKQLATASGDPAALRHGVSRVTFHREILFRLTVAREERPALYRHSLSVAVIAQYLAMRLEQRPSFIDNILMAALCHDLGELYTDPAILEPGHRVSDEERRFIYVHPITGWLIVRGLKYLHSDVAAAIIQHQERLDGSGYPKGLHEAAICLPGRILAAADVAASIMTRFHDYRRLSTLLRLNNKKYDRNVTALLHFAFIALPEEGARLEGQAFKQSLTSFAKLLEGWSQLRADAATSQSTPVLFLLERMYNLRTDVLAFGFDPDSLEVTLQLAAEDAAIATELASVIDELQFQLADLAREIDRHAADWQRDLAPAASAAFEQWRGQLRDCIRSPDSGEN